MKKINQKQKVSYNETYWKMVDKMKTSETFKEEEIRKDIFEDLEKILKGKKMVVEGNLLSL